MTNGFLPPHQFQAVSSELLVDAPIIAVRRDQVVMPGGSIAPREVVEHFGAVAVVALNEHNQVRLIRQYRRAVDQFLWELPAGLLDFADEDPLTAAQRELVEEAGLQAENWAVLTDLITSPGFCDEAARVFLATGLTAVPRPAAADDEEALLEAKWVDLQAATQMVLSGEIANGICIAGILAAAVAQLPDAPQLREASCPFALRPQALATRRLKAGISGDLKKLPS